MFNFITNQLNKISSQFSRIASFFTKEKINDATLKELETLLIQADTGPKTTQRIIQTLRSEITNNELSGDQLKKMLCEQLENLLVPFGAVEQKVVYLLIGVNGSGKTTFAGKLAHLQATKGRSVYLVAADTFRAAASEQLKIWAEKAGVNFIQGKPEQDPGSVVFLACEQYKKDNGDILIIDTAGRLQTKINLMNELTKIKKIIQRQLPHHQLITLLTIDSMLGQNSLNQAQLFHESTTINGIVLTKIDGTGKGGAIFAISSEIKLPIAYISAGEKIDQLFEFNSHNFVQSLFNI